MYKITYMPILRWQTGEQDALKNLALSQNNVEFIPILELVDVVTPQQFFKDLARCYNGPVYIDASRCDENCTLLKSLIIYANNNNFVAWPLLYPDDLFESFVEFTNLSSRLSVKLPIPEDFDSVPNKDMIDFILQSKNSSFIDLILNVGEIIDKKQANEAFALYKTHLDLHNESTFFKNIIICLTSFPSKLEIDAGDTKYYTRYDINIYEFLRKNYIELPLGYSDYGISKFTEIELDFRFMQYGILPKIKYTISNKYVVSKGQKDHRKGIYIRSQIDMCKDIIQSNYFSGKDFSYGDSIIYDKATVTNSGPGNQKQWVTYCTNHHLTFVVEQLSNLFVT